MNLIEQLKQIPDHRKKRGKRHPLWVVLGLILLGVLCNYQGYRPLVDFCQQHWQELQTLLELPPETKIPSYSTFRRVIQGVDFQPLVKILNQWQAETGKERTGEWLAIDGKSIKCTLKNSTGSNQNFTTTVSAFSHQSAEVVALSVQENKEISEIEVAKQLIMSLQGQKVAFTLDALHCQKDTVSLIVNQQQDYLIALKGNQPSLRETVESLHRNKEPISYAEEFDTSHCRLVRRRLWVYNAPVYLRQHWASLQSLIMVERSGWRDDKPFEETFAFISNLSVRAQQFLSAIRLHWGIENRLHWVRDVLFLEDFGLRRGGNAPIVWAILHCFIITAVRRLGCRTIPQGQRLLANQLNFVFSLLSS